MYLKPSCIYSLLDIMNILYARYILGNYDKLECIYMYVRVYEKHRLLHLLP